MNKLKVIFDDGVTQQVVVLSGSSTPTVDEAIDRLLNEDSNPNDEISVVKSFLRQTGIKLVVETPESSWVDRVQFDEDIEMITFVPTYDGEAISYDSSLELFLEDIKAPSIGKVQWQYRRGLRGV